MSLEILRNYSDLREALPQASESFIQDYLAFKDETRETLNTIADSIEGLAPQFGSGSPEGVVTSNLNRTYFDTSGATVIMYVNELSGEKTNWKEVS